MTRTVVDAGLLYQIIAGHDPKDGFSDDRSLGEIALRKSLKSIRVGLPSNFFFDAVEPEVEQTVRKAAVVMEDLGAAVVSIEVPGISELTQASGLSLQAEAWFQHKDHFEKRGNDLGEDVRKRLEASSKVSSFDYVKAQATRARVRREIEEMFRSVDVFITPTTPMTAFAVDATKVRIGGKEEEVGPAATRLLRGFNASGHPALSVCCGFDSQGLPVGLQIVGRMWNEATVLHVGYAYEQAAAWHTRRSSL
jgi:aspartyl-tRNA(Asn)/glutamyl-tRNA(Gln) amidotransferase subunit A